MGALKGQRSNRAKFPDSIALKIKQMKKEGYTVKTICDRFSDYGCIPGDVYNINYTYKDLDKYLT